MIDTAVLAVTAFVVILNVAVFAPAATVTLNGDDGMFNKPKELPVKACDWNVPAAPGPKANKVKFVPATTFGIEKFPDASVLIQNCRFFSQYWKSALVMLEGGACATPTHKPADEVFGLPLSAILIVPATVPRPDLGT